MAVRAPGLRPVRAAGEGKLREGSREESFSGKKELSDQTPSAGEEHHCVS